ncbi:uncharacterized protein LOC144023865 [Festucalex cinctus]
MMAHIKEQQLQNYCLTDHYNDLEKTKSALTERKRLLNEKLAHLECQSVKMEEEKKDLSDILKDSQENEQKNSLDEEVTQRNCRTVTLETEDADLTTKLNKKVTLTEVNDHKMTLFKTWSVNMETDHEKLWKQVKVLEETNTSFTRQNELLCEKLAHNESWSVKMKTHLMMQIKCLQESEDTLTKQNESLNNNVAQLKKWAGVIEKQNENLQARVNLLKENENIMNEMLENLTANLAHDETQRDKDQADMYCMRTKLQPVWFQLQDQGELLRRLDHAESRLKTTCAENESLGNKLRELQDKDEDLKKQNDRVREEQEQLISLRDQQSEQIAQLKTAVKDQQHQLDKVQFVIYSKDELLAKQKRELEELNSLVSTLKQTIHQLQSQLQLRNMENKRIAETGHEERVSDNQLDLRTDRNKTRVQMKALHQNSHPFIEQKRLFKHLTLCEPSGLKMETEKEELRTPFQELQQDQVRMTEMNSHLKEKLAHIERWHAKREDLKAKVEYRNDDDKTENIISDLCQFESQLDKENIKSPQSKLDSQTFLFHLKDPVYLKKTIDHVETLAKTESTETEKLSNSQCDIDEKDNVLKMNEIVGVELGDHKFIGKQQTKNLAHLETEFKDHKLQVEESGIVLRCIKDDFLTLKPKEINHGDKRGDDLLFITLAQSIHEFQRKLKRMEEILMAD